MYGLVFRKKGGKYAKKRRKVGCQPNRRQDDIKPVPGMEISWKPIPVRIPVFEF